MVLQWSTQQGIKLSDSFSCTARGLLAGKKKNLLLFALLLRLEWSYGSVQFSSCENPELCMFNMFFFYSSEDKAVDLQTIE